jgi:undecaprenyl phosphate N,N'-diacetylbacillosamine 1-phosphate transferase
LYIFFKGLIDRFFALTLLVVLSPIILITGIIIYFKIGSPIIFTQPRPTRGERVFRIYKFRTMSNDRDENGELLPDEVRLGKFGKLLRSLSIDELPQLFNVLKGDLSFIGPRPLLVEYLPIYSDFQKERHTVNGGMSGLAQIKGRNDLSWKNKFRYDVFYARHISLKMDLYILFLTVWKILKRSGVSKKGKATTEKFNGKN